MNGIEELNNLIDKDTITLIVDNETLIESFCTRLNKRLLSIFTKFSIPFSSEMLTKITNEYLLDSFISVNSEVANSYKKVLLKYFDIINEYYHNNENSIDKIKSTTSKFIKGMISKENPILNISICNNYLNEINSKIYVYDNYMLNKDIDFRIKEDVKDILKELNKLNKEYAIKELKEIIKFVLSKNNL